MQQESLPKFAAFWQIFSLPLEHLKKDVVLSELWNRWDAILKLTRLKYNKFQN